MWRGSPFFQRHGYIPAGSRDNRCSPLHLRLYKYHRIQEPLPRQGRMKGRLCFWPVHMLQGFRMPYPVQAVFLAPLYRRSMTTRLSYEDQYLLSYDLPHQKNLRPSGRIQVQMNVSARN